MQFTMHSLHFHILKKDHLHGELVGFGILLLLLCDNDMETFDRLYEFNKSINLPVALKMLKLVKKIWKL